MKRLARRHPTDNPPPRSAARELWLRARAPHSSLERTDGIDDDPTLTSVGNGFSSTPAKVQKRSNGDFKGLRLSKQTHCSSSDSGARRFRKSNGNGAFFNYPDHCLKPKASAQRLVNRHGLEVASEVTPVDGYGKRAAAVRMTRSLQGTHQKTLGAKKGFDTRYNVADIRYAGITPHGAQNVQARSRSAIDDLRFPPKAWTASGLRRGDCTGCD